MTYSKNNIPSKPLELYNEIVFTLKGKEYRGRVETYNFINIEGYDNSILFEIAGLNRDGKNEFASIIYCKDTNTSGWPEINYNSVNQCLEGLTNLTILMLNEEKFLAAVELFKKDKDKFQKEILVEIANIEAEWKKEYLKKLEALSESDREIVSFFNEATFSKDVNNDIIGLVSALTNCPIKTFLK